MIRTHWGQHDADCFGCHVSSLTFDAGGPKLHNPKGDLRWESDPVKNRIEELHGITIDTDDLNRKRSML